MEYLERSLSWYREIQKQLRDVFQRQMRESAKE